MLFQKIHHGLVEHRFLFNVGDVRGVLDHQELRVLDVGVHLLWAFAHVAKAINPMNATQTTLCESR